MMALATVLNQPFVSLYPKFENMDWTIGLSAIGLFFDEFFDSLHLRRGV